MARKTIEVVITDEGRDLGKTFLITEKPALVAEKWAWRLFLSAARAGVDVPPNILSAGFSGLATFGIQALARGLSFDDVEPLLDDMLEDIQIIPNPKQHEIVRPLVLTDIEEVKTLLRLRLSWFELHVNFSLADAKLN